MPTEMICCKMYQYPGSVPSLRLSESARRFHILPLIMLLFACGCAAKPTSADAAAIVRIEQLGGKVQIDPEGLEHRVIKAYLHDTPTADPDLASLAGLTQLQLLALGNTRISDSGLEHLRGLVRLKTLSLNGTAVTDAGLQHLAALKNLKTLNLQETQVTAAGIAKLKRSLPQLRVAH